MNLEECVCGTETYTRLLSPAPSSLLLSPVMGVLYAGLWVLIALQSETQGPIAVHGMCECSLCSPFQAQCNRRLLYFCCCAPQPNNQRVASESRRYPGGEAWQQELVLAQGVAWLSGQFTGWARGPVLGRVLSHRFRNETCHFMLCRLLERGLKLYLRMCVCVCVVLQARQRPGVAT